MLWGIDNILRNVVHIRSKECYGVKDITLIIPISVCYFLELRNVVISYSQEFNFSLIKFLEGHSDMIEHEWLRLVKYYVMIK